VRYATALTVEDISALYGYQIQVAAPTEDSVTLNNLINGTVTETVYRDGSVFLAVLASEELSGEVALCEILSDYGVGDTAQERNVTVTKLELVTSIASEAMLTLGPDPAAAILALPSTELLFGLPLWTYIGLILAVLLVMALLGIVLLLRRKHRGEARHSRREPEGQHFRPIIP
jgi:hypothetical protein